MFGSFYILYIKTMIYILLKVFLTCFEKMLKLFFDNI